LVENPLVVVPVPAADGHSDDRTLYLGDDETGRAFEVLTVPSRTASLSST